MILFILSIIFFTPLSIPLIIFYTRLIEFKLSLGSNLSLERAKVEAILINQVWAKH